MCLIKLVIFGAQLICDFFVKVSRDQKDGGTKSSLPLAVGNRGAKFAHAILEQPLSHSKYQNRTHQVLHKMFFETQGLQLPGKVCRKKNDKFELIFFVEYLPINNCQSHSTVPTPVKLGWEPYYAAVGNHPLHPATQPE